MEYFILVVHRDLGMQLIKRFGKQLSFVILMSSSVIWASSVSARPLPTESLPIESLPTESLPTESLPIESGLTKKAMTWIVNTSVSTNVYNGGKTYIQARYDEQTNAYSGDTPVNQVLSLLCIRKPQELVNNPIPAFTQSAITPGGASKNSWSGGEVFAIPNVVGSSLLSSADADEKCRIAGQNRYGLADFRMAEFHDGSEPSAGWGFWAQSDDPNLSIAGKRYWVKINDQNANPW